MKVNRAREWLGLLANFGVLGGLVFLGIEVSQNTRALQAAAIQESINVARQQILMFATNPDLNRITMMDFEDLGEEDRQRAFWVDRSFWLGMQGMYRQWELGVLPDEEWGVWQKIICTNFEPNGELWSGNRSLLIPSFVRVVESCPRTADDGILP
jgi:hypothetical protein